MLATLTRHPCAAGMGSTPVRLTSTHSVSSDTRNLMAQHAPMTGSSYKEHSKSSRSRSGYANLDEGEGFEEPSNGSSSQRELKRSRTKLTVMGPPVMVTNRLSRGVETEPAFVHGSLTMLKVRAGGAGGVSLPRGERARRCVNRRQAAATAPVKGSCSVACLPRSGQRVVPDAGDRAVRVHAGDARILSCNGLRLLVPGHPASGRLAGRGDRAGAKN